MIFLSIFICFYLFFFRRQRRNFLYRTHVKTSSCGMIEWIERIKLYVLFFFFFKSTHRILQVSQKITIFVASNEKLMW